MLKNYGIALILVLFVYIGNAQELKFGVHAEPIISFMDSDYSKIESEGLNPGFSLGVELEYYFTSADNYALTFGVDFSYNKGGTLLYEYGAVHFKNTELDNFDSYVNSLGIPATSGENIEFQSFTRINYSINYLELPVGLKLRTNELGQSYMRAFFHIPIVKFGVPVTGSARIFDEAVDAAGYEDDLTGYQVNSDGEGFIREPNVWKDITPIQFSIGAGLGAEYSPNAEGGLRLAFGIYYDAGLIDVTNTFGGETDYIPATTVTNPNPSVITKSPRNALHNIALRLGVVF